MGLVIVAVGVRAYLPVGTIAHVNKVLSGI